VDNRRHGHFHGPRREKRVSSVERWEKDSKILLKKSDRIGDRRGKIKISDPQMGGDSS